MAIRFLAFLSASGTEAVSGGWAVPVGRLVRVTARLSLAPASGFFSPADASVTADFDLTVTNDAGVPQSWLTLLASGQPVSFFSLGGGISASSAATLQGTPPSAGRYNVVVRANVSGTVSGEGVVVSPLPVLFAGVLTVAAGTTPGVDVAPVFLSWFQASFLATERGAKIRRATWRDAYLIFRRSLWVRVPFDASTKLEGADDVVRSTQFTAADFTATDWVAHSAVDLEDLAAAQTINLRFG